MSNGFVVAGFLFGLICSRDILMTLRDLNESVREQTIDLICFAMPSIDARTHDILAKETVDIDDLTDVDVRDLVERESVRHDPLSSRWERRNVFYLGEKLGLDDRPRFHIAAPQNEPLIDRLYA